MLDDYVDGVAEDELSSHFKYDIPPTSTAVVSRREATIHAAGGAQYSSVNGVRAVVFKLYQEAQYLDRVRSRVAMHLGAFHESGEWRYGRKVLSALDSFAVPRETPDELRHDLDLLHKLEAALDGSDAKTVPDDVPDDDLPELAICLREEIENLRGSVDDARRSIASLEARAHDQGLPPPPSSARRDMPPSPP